MYQGSGAIYLHILLQHRLQQYLHTSGMHMYVAVRDSLCETRCSHNTSISRSISTPGTTKATLLTSSNTSCVLITCSATLHGTWLMACTKSWSWGFFFCCLSRGNLSSLINGVDWKLFATVYQGRLASQHNPLIMSWAILRLQMYSLLLTLVPLDWEKEKSPGCPISQKLAEPQYWNTDRPLRILFPAGKVWCSHVVKQHYLFQSMSIPRSH